MSATALSADLPAESVQAVADTREKLRYNFAPLQMVDGNLSAGDYSVVGLEHLIAIERKSLPDLIMCCGVERERFERELQRLLSYQTRAVVVEASWADLERGGWRSKLTPKSATGSVLGWIGMGIPFLLCGSREAGQTATARLLYLAARRRYRELRGLLAEPSTTTKAVRAPYKRETLAAFSIEASDDQ